MPRNQGIGRTGKKHKKSANDNIHRQQSDKAGARRWPRELNICWQTDPPTEKWCSAGCDDIRRGQESQELWRDAWIEADTSHWKNEGWLCSGGRRGP